MADLAQPGCRRSEHSGWLTRTQHALHTIASSVAKSVTAEAVMSMQALYKDPHDKALHQRAIERLARKVNRPLARVKTAYEGEYALLKIDAKVTDFLGIFASRRAHDALLRTPA